MNNRVRDILLMRKTGKVVPVASRFDKSLGLYLNDRDYGGVITTATGNPVSIITNKAQNAISTLLSYSPKQSGSGDPSPINVRPIEGWTEANLYRADGTAKAYNANTTVAQSGGVSVTILSSTAFEMKSTGVSEQYPASKQLLSYLNLTNGKTYTIYAYIDIKTITTKNVRFGIRNASNNFVSGKSVRVYDLLPVGEDKGLIAVRFTYDSSTDNYLSLTQLRTAVNTEAFDFVLSQIKVLEDTTSDTPTIITANLGGTYYGFSVDVERGVLRVTQVGFVYDGSDDENWGSINLTINVFGVIGLTDYDSADMCDSYKMISRGSSSGLADLECRLASSRATFMVRNTNYATLNAFKNNLALSPITVVYTLATPIELPLTPQVVALLSGNNTLWTDGDSLSVTYKAPKS